MAYVSEDMSYNLLAKAIVVQAAEDYGNALLGRVYMDNGQLIKDPRLRDSKIAELKKFFMSDDLALYTKVPGKAIMKEVEEQVKYWPRRRKFVLANVI